MMPPPPPPPPSPDAGSYLEGLKLLASDETICDMMRDRDHWSLDHRSPLVDKQSVLSGTRPGDSSGGAGYVLTRGALVNPTVLPRLSIITHKAPPGSEENGRESNPRSKLAMLTLCASSFAKI